MTAAHAAVIVGASAAGVSAARTLRAEGFEDQVILIDADPRPPYERPPLSKQLLRDSRSTCSDFPLLTLPEAKELRIDLRLGRKVARLSRDPLSVVMDDGEVVEACHVLLATGGRARRLSLPGADLAGIHVVRSSADVERFRPEVDLAETTAVIGGGLIGAETATALADAGRRVVWLDAAPRPMAHIFPEVIARHLTVAHIERANLTLISDARLIAFVQHRGRVAGIVLADGSVIDAQIVILGVGMEPEDGLARMAGLAVSNGVHVDAAQRTSAPGIYAAGDVAGVENAETGQRVRHEHWRTAEHQGANAARAILGLDPAPPPISWFWSDQGNQHVEMAGRLTGDSVQRGGPRPIVFEMAGDKVVGVASIDEPNAVRIGLRLIRAGRDLDRRRLADPATDLKELLQ